MHMAFVLNTEVWVGREIHMPRALITPISLRCGRASQAPWTSAQICPNDTGEICTAQIGILEVGILEVGILEICVPEICPLQVGTEQHTAFQIGSFQVGPL